MQAKNALEQTEAELTDNPVSGVSMDAVQDESLLSDLIREVQRIARSACRGMPQHVRVDIESSAMVGLMEALRHFDDMNPEQFRRYLNARVRGALREEARHFDPLSADARRLVRQVEQVTDEYRKKNGRIPDIEEVAGELGYDEDDCWNALELSEFSVLPLSDETVCGDILTPEDAFVGSYSATALRWGLAQLDKRERLVLRLAYKRGLPLSAIARRLQVSTPRAYQIRVEAERNLAQLLRKSPALSKMRSAGMKFDWDDYTEETLRDRPRLRAALRNQMR